MLHTGIYVFGCNDVCVCVANHWPNHLNINFPIIKPEFKSHYGGNLTIGKCLKIELWID